MFGKNNNKKIYLPFVNFCVLNAILKYSFGKLLKIYRIEQSYIPKKLCNNVYVYEHEQWSIVINGKLF